MKIQTILAVCMAAILAASIPIGVAAQDERAAEAAVAAKAAEATEAKSQIKGVRQRVLKAMEAEPAGESPAAASDSIALPDGGGTRDYTCASGNCSCAGAKDCIIMKDICAPGTMTCNDYGCTCAEKPDEGGDGG